MPRKARIQISALVSGGESPTFFLRHVPIIKMGDMTPGEYAQSSAIITRHMDAMIEDLKAAALMSGGSVSGPGVL